LIVLALHPGRALALETFKTQLYDCDPAEVTTAQIQTPISRLRLAGLPIPPRAYLLDVAPSDVDVVDFDARAKGLVDRCVYPEQMANSALEGLLDEGFELHQLWQHDPAAAVGDRPRLNALFESQRRRHRRFGEVFVRLLLRTGDRDRARDILYEYVDRYGTDEIFQDLELEVRTPPRPSVDTPTAGVVLPGSAGAGAALAEVRERFAASAETTVSQLAVGAHNLDRLYVVDRLRLESEALIGAPVEVPGGAAANTAFALARLGQRVATAGIVADDRDGALIRQSLEQEHVDLSALVVAPTRSGIRTGSTSIVVDHAGGRLTLIDPGANAHLAQVLREDTAAHQRLLELARHARMINLSSFSGDAERRLQEDILDGVPDHVIVALDPGALYARLGLDRLAVFVLRCDVLYVYERRLQQMIDNSSSEPSMQEGPPSCRALLEALFRWRAARIDRPLVAVVKRPRLTGAGGPFEPANEGYEMITIAVGRSTVEDWVSARAPGSLELPFVDSVGQGDAIAAAVHLGLLSGAPLDECADLASVFANEVVSEIGSRAGLPRRSTVAAVWAKYFPRVDLPAWVPSG